MVKRELLKPALCLRQDELCLGFATERPLRQHTAVKKLIKPKRTLNHRLIDRQCGQLPLEHVKEMTMSQVNSDIPKDNHETVETMNPATGEVHQTYTMHTKDEMNQIVEDAHTAFLSWRKTSMEERAKILNKTADIVDREKHNLATMMAKQMGKPIKQGVGESELCAEILRFTAKQGPEVLADQEQEVMSGSRGLVSFSPLGVILGMQPWNFPMYQCMRYSCAVIMGGNTTVFKHATICLEMAHKIQEMYEEGGLPKNVFSIVYAGGSDTDDLIAHDKVRGVTYTGSAEIGRKVAEKAGKYLRKNVMELGGSDPYIVLDDADIDHAVAETVKGRIDNCGQVCTGVKRVLIHSSIYDEFRDKFVEQIKATKVGDPLEEGTDMGPMSTSSLRDDVHEQVQQSVKAGAKLLCGGEIPDKKGAWYTPTVLEDIPKDAPAYKDEIFGPVASLFKFETVEEALEIANSHRYGLGGGVFSKDVERALKICREDLDVGIPNVNRYGNAQPNVPFGGVRDSGYGREHAGFGLREFVNAKGITIN